MYKSVDIYLEPILSMQTNQADATWITSQSSVLLLHLWVQPGAKKTEIVGEYSNCLKIKVQAPPVDGAANEALIAFLAKILGIRKNQIRVEKGDTTRRKCVACEGISKEALLAAINLNGHPPKGRVP